MTRLGEILLAEKILTATDLNSALENHILHGVKLGTCLVEMGYASDDDVARCLGKQTGRQFMTKDELLAAGAQNLSIVSPAAIKKHRFIPVGLDGSALLVATDQDPSPKKLIELEKFIGRKIEPMMVSGYAVDCFMEKVFGMPRPGRFLPRYSRKKSSDSTPQISEAVKRDESSLVINGVEWKNLGEVTQGDESAQIFEEFFNISVKQDEYPRTLSDAAERLSHARSRDDVARTVLGFLSKSSVTSALVTIKDGFVRGWKASADGKNIPEFESFSTSLELLPEIERCFAMKKPSFGTASTPETQLLFHTLRYGAESSAYFPIFIQRRVVAVLMCDESKGLSPVEIVELCRKASYALEILILRAKLLSS